MAVVALEGVSVRHGAQVALEDVPLAFTDGELFALLRRWPGNIGQEADRIVLPPPVGRM